MATSNRKRTTVADLIAAAELGAIDTSTEVVTDDGSQPEQRPERGSNPSPDHEPVELSATDHACGIPGCRHGAAHTGIVQPDRQLKLACPNCGAVARLTAAALARCGELHCGNDGGVFAVAARRAYNRKAQ